MTEAREVQGKTLASSRRILGSFQSNSSKVELEASPKGPHELKQKKIIKCPDCLSQRHYKDGTDYLVDGSKVQRFLCRDCGRRFRPDRRSRPIGKMPYSPEESKIILASNELTTDCQVCVPLVRGTKNLDPTKEIAVSGDLTSKNLPNNDEGLLIDFLWHMRKQAYAEATAKTRMKLIRQLRNECNIMDPEAVKKAIAMHEYVDKEGKTRPWSDGHKAVVVQAYSCFAEMLKISWDAPFYETNKTLPFVPLESEVDCLISGSGKKMATCLQLLKETGMRIGEAWRLKWTDLDTENSTIRCQAEKHGNPRQFKISPKLLAMFNSLPKKSENIFGTESLNGFRWKFDLKKRRLAETQQNPRLLQIKLHTFRHFFATMLYHRTKSILEVKEKLGHRRIESTMVYTHLVNFENDQYNSAIAKTIAEERALIEDGFEFVRYDEKDELAIYRKRK